MPDAQSPVPGNAPQVKDATRVGKGLKIALALSLAVNLAVAGVVIGAALKFQRDGGRMAVPRDLAFGPYSEALTRDQRRTLLDGMRQNGNGLKGIRTELQADLAAVLTSLRAQPFDASQFRLALEEQNARLAERVADGREGLIAVVSAMSDAERQDFAKNIERRLGERRHRD